MKSIKKYKKNKLFLKFIFFVKSVIKLRKDIRLKIIKKHLKLKKQKK